MEKENDLIFLANIQKILSEKPDANQRDLAKAIDISLGMTNSLVKRFSEKGWIFLHKLSAKNIRYVLTAEGMSELSKRTSKYLKRTIKSAADYKDCILQTIKNAKEGGSQKVFVIGQTDILFIIEYACKKLDIVLIHCQNQQDFVTTYKNDPQINTLVFYDDDLQLDNHINAHFIDIYTLLRGNNEH